jgi:hypothetical protein
MSFVIFHKETTCYLRVFANRHWKDATGYATVGSANAALTRETKRRTAELTSNGEKFEPSHYGILPHDEFLKIEKTETKINLLSGLPFTQSVNTPACCDPSTETYHSM